MTDLADRGAGAVDDTDAVDLILADHEEMERLLRLLRDDTQDRVAVRAELADLLVAHAEAEEDVVYPVLERQADAEGEDDVEDEVEHGEEEHAEINEALLAVLELDDLDGDEFTEALEELGEMVHHHHHLVCTDCGRVDDVTFPDDFEASLSRAAEGVVDRHGYRLDAHHLELTGVCGDCDRVG